MTTTLTTSSKQGINFKRLALGVGAILLIPLLGRWPWSAGDFIVMGILLSSAGAALDIVSRKVNKDNRLIASIAVILTFLIIWAQLSVGLIAKIISAI